MQKKAKYSVKAYKSGASVAFRADTVSSRKKVEKFTTQAKKNGATRIEMRLVKRPR